MSPTRSAPIGPDGAYTIKTLTGINQVSFEGEVATKNRGVGLVKDFAEIASGSNKKDFDLMGDSGGKKIQFPADGKRAVNKSPKGALAIKVDVPLPLWFRDGEVPLTPSPW